MDKVERKVIIMKSGDQIPVSTSPGAIVSFYVGEDRSEDAVTLDVTDKEFEALQKQAVTNNIPTAILRDKKVSKLNDDVHPRTKQLKDRR
ncbi:hypothetical protein [Mycolicibacterium sp. S3B2]|uniref:hypothetical protein n=1 Tax=Mycolicibacterium sp. S3B2 TaxID=3415120 RepID=UPI003C7D36A3